MLRSAGGQPVLGTANPAVRRRCASGPEAEQRLKGGHRLPPTVVPKDELIEVDLQLRLADPVVRANQPLLQIADRAIRQRHRGGNTLPKGAPDRLGTGDVSDASGLQSVKGFQSVAVNRRSRGDLLLHEREDRRLFDVRDDRHANPTRYRLVSPPRPAPARLFGL